MKKPKKYTEQVGAKLDSRTAEIIKNSKYNFREAIEYFANKIIDPVESLKIRRKILVEEIELIMIREVNPLKAELGEVEYKLKQFDVNVTVEDTVLVIARTIKNLHIRKKEVYPDLLSFIKSDKNLVAEVNRCNMPFDEFIELVEQLNEDE